MMTMFEHENKCNTYVNWDKYVRATKARHIFWIFTAAAYSAGVSSKASLMVRNID